MKPTKAQIAKLIQSYALKIYSADENIRTAQRLHNQFDSKLQLFAARFPNYDTSSNSFWASMEQHAKLWWSTRAFKGAGVDW